jgi:hypothetical protein
VDPNPVGVAASLPAHKRILPDKEPKSRNSNHPNPEDNNQSLHRPLKTSPEKLQPRNFPQLVRQSQKPSQGTCKPNNSLRSCEVAQFPRGYTPSPERLASGGGAPLINRPPPWDWQHPFYEDIADATRSNAYGRRNTPCSVMIAVISSPGVTSNAGLNTVHPSGPTCTPSM